MKIPKYEKQMFLRQIKNALHLHYQKRGYILQELLCARENFRRGDEYTFCKGLFGTKYANREIRIFLRDGVYKGRYGWSTSSDKSFY